MIDFVLPKEASCDDVCMAVYLKNLHVYTKRKLAKREKLEYMKPMDPGSAAMAASKAALAIV